MFGYIKIYKDELKGKQVKLYKKIYCLLCTYLGNKFGLVYRLFNSYDITFFISIFDAISAEKNKNIARCPFNRKVSLNIDISNKAIEYGTLVNLFWILQIIRDNKIDNDHKLKMTLLKIIINKNRKIQNTINDNYDLLVSWNSIMDDYYQDEFQGDNFDSISGNIGKAYATVFKDYVKIARLDIDENILYDLGYNLGIYIFLMDAFDDYFDDLKRKKFNPITKMKDYSTIKNDNKRIVEKITLMTNLLIVRMEELINKLGIQKSENYCIINNVISYGMMYVCQGIARKKYEVTTDVYN